jgi:hypothetical protein
MNEGIFSSRQILIFKGKALSLGNFYFTADVLQTARMSLIFADFFLILSEYADFSQAESFRVNPPNPPRAKHYQG